MSMLPLAIAISFCLYPLQVVSQSAPDTVQRHIEAAQQDMQQKHPELAIGEFEAALAIDPQNNDAQANLGVLQYFAGQYEKSIPHLKAAVQHKPGLWKIQALLGLAEDRLKQTAGSPAQPDPEVWAYDTGGSGWGNAELETYCAWGSSIAPCNTATPNAYVGTDGYLHIAALQPAAGVYTSARLKTQGLFSFQYGRLEFRAQVPEARGLWPAGWLLGNNVATINWPGCGEQDVMERVNAATNPDFNQGSVHGPGFTGVSVGSPYHFPTGVTAATWHTYGMIWKPGTVSYYVDDPANLYATFSNASLSGLSRATWPFDGGQSNFIVLNLAVGGNYPGAPTPGTPFPAQILVDYVRLYTN